ncbi:MAG: hypothetical protein AB9866_14430 [Syntrophobacteraceae bacterium]
MPQRKRSHISKSSKEMGHFPVDLSGRGKEKPKLEIVLKCDSMGSVEAVSALLTNMKLPEADIKILHSGVGAVSKQDLLMAMTGNRLVIGFSVGVAPKLDQWVKEQGVEVRLYDVIYRLAEDVKLLAQSQAPVEPEEKVTGKCEVIATFKSKKGGTILGCEVVDGSVQVGKNFRVVTAMGPVHSSRIESLQVENKAVKEARSGQQVGVKIAGTTTGKVGDFIECYEVTGPKKPSWTPKGQIIHLGFS